MAPLDAFNESAAFYDALFDEETRLAREGPLLRELLGGAPSATAVDIACGTGPHARFLARAGAMVDAFDVSDSMVAYARRARPHPDLRYAQGDMRTLEGGPWGLALCLGNSLSLLADTRELARVFERVHACLAPGGAFVTQVLNYAALDSARHTVVRKSLDDAALTVVKSLVPGAERVFLSLAFFAEQDGMRRNVAEAAVLLPILPAIHAGAAEAAGFTVENHYGAFDKSPFSKDSSPDSLFVFGKPL